MALNMAFLLSKLEYFIFLQTQLFLQLIRKMPLQFTFQKLFKHYFA